MPHQREAWRWQVYLFMLRRQVGKQFLWGLALLCCSWNINVCFCTQANSSGRGPAVELFCFGAGTGWCCWLVAVAYLTGRGQQVGVGWKGMRQKILNWEMGFLYLCPSLTVLSFSVLPPFLSSFISVFLLQKYQILHTFKHKKWISLFVTNPWIVVLIHLCVCNKHPGNMLQGTFPQTRPQRVWFSRSGAYLRIFILVSSQPSQWILL